jgi:hypothetical protein
MVFAGTSQIQGVYYFEVYMGTKMNHITSIVRFIENGYGIEPGKHI